MTGQLSAGQQQRAPDAPAAHPSPTASPGGVLLDRLRAGRADEPLFLVPGLEGVLTELAPLVAAFTGPQEVYALAPLLEDAHGRPVSLEHMAELMIAAMRRVQPVGPYRLGGYSFGGLLALEMAQQLRIGGDVVEALFLIEAVYDERYWPRGIWLRALARRTGRQLARIVRMHPAKAVGELGRRGRRLVQRVMRRNTAAPDPLHAHTSGEDPRAGRAYAAISGYRPRFYDGSITLIASSVDRHFGCDTVRLWRGYAGRIEVERVDGDHLTVVQEPEGAIAVARVIDHRLALVREDWIGVRPVPGFERPMILTTMRWVSAARLAHSLIEAGFRVSACRPAGHALELIDALTSDCRLHRLWQLRSLATAIRSARPDIILADDERALVLLRRLYARTRITDPQVAAVIAHSLGNVADWPAIASRAALAREARSMGIATPATTVIDNAASLLEWAAGRNPPMVLKTDGSWGGRGVAIIRDTSRLSRTWRTISGPPGLPRAVKRLLVNREAGPLGAWIRRARPVVNAQEFVEGREAIATVACINGEVQAVVCLEVEKASEPKGPASVVRIIDHPAMAEAARRLVARFGLSGFCGFDFIITPAGVAQLLELNPRVTPTCHLLVEGDYQRHRTIALFPPRERARDAESAASELCVLDVPVRAPSLVQRGGQIAARQQRPVARAVRRLRQKLTVPRY